MVSTLQLAILALALHSLTPQPQMSRQQLAQHSAFGFAWLEQETGLDAAFLWSFYITETGGKSPALVNGYNFGGMQAQGKTLKFGSVAEGVYRWIECLTHSWYNDCQGLSGMERQKCWRQKNYHGGTAAYRYGIEKKYKNYFNP